jgi:hypothetical protein
MHQEYAMTEIYGFAAVIVTIFVGMLFNNHQFGSIETRLNGIDSRVDKMNSDLSGRINYMGETLNARIDQMKTELTARIDHMGETLNVRMNHMDSNLNMRLDRQQSDLSQFYENLGRHDAKIEMLEKKAS